MLLPIRIRRIHLSLVWVGMLLLAPRVGAGEGGVPTISLAGSWRFQLDRADAGIPEHWFERRLELHIELPGALQNQGFGDDITVDTPWTGAVGVDRWKQQPQYAKYREPGNIKVPFFLQPQRHYVGAAWYQRDIEIPPAWAGQRVVLTLERPHWETRVWLDGRLVGSNDSLATPHVYELGVGVTPGKHTLTIRVDNRMIVEVGEWSHSVSDHTQGNWNGVVGRIALSATEPVWIEDLQVYPHVATKSVTVKGRVGRAAGQRATDTVALSVRDRSDPSLHSPITKAAVRWSDRGGTFEAQLKLSDDAVAWDEFHPRLYEVAAWAGTRPEGASGRQVLFGLREITTRGREFLLNGHPAFFRGTLECCIFPKTGYPPTDVESWRRIIRICKEHGLNHIRFHSWCPPEAAFIAADELGFYYQVECGVWTQPGNGKPIDQWIYKESERIVRAYGNHPSFMLLTHGNEPHGPKREEFLAKWVTFWKPDGRFLVTGGTAYPQLPENQYHVYYPCRGPHGWLGLDYRNDVAKLDVPVIVHEDGQWCAYPNFDEVKKYTGPLQPKNFEIFRDSLAEHGMLDQDRDFVYASGKLQALCYKEEVEAALRTPGIGGVQLLDLHDFPGQGTALVGVLDPFWDSKGYITAQEFRRFYGPTVPLARLLKRTWTTEEVLTCDVEVAHFGAAPLANAVPVWRLCADDGTTVARGELTPQALPLGRTTLGRISVDLNNLAAPKAYRLIVGLKDTPAENDWNVWIYPAKSETAKPGDVLVTATLDEMALARLAVGGKVLLLAPRLSSEHPRLYFQPIFWNRYMFNTRNQQTLGLLCDPKHPALALFPTESWQDWQWNDIVTTARAMVLDDLPQNLRPIVQPIDDWNTNRRLGLVFECRVGSGRLLVCSADLENNEHPAARQLRASLLAYAASDRFQPKVQVAPEALAKMLARTKPSNLVRLGARVLEVDSEDAAHGNVAAHALDGDPDTFWHTRWTPRNDPMPHHLALDLGRAVTIKGLTCLPRQDLANGRIAEAEVFVSNDPKSWGVPVAQAKWRDSGELQTVAFPRPVSGRYLKLVVKSEVKGNAFAAVAELDVILDEKWQEIDGTRIPVPPAEHPRLYLRAEQVAQLPQRLKEPVLQPAVQSLQAQAQRSPQARVEWEALQYLVTHDERAGRAVIAAALPLLQKCELAQRQDACRETGRMMVTGAIVYDWCYRLLTAEEKQAFIRELVRLAKTQECGYPPTGQGSVTGHSSEAMIMRDMLSAGIAIYDEFPEMYRLAAGRFFREHLPVRNWFYPGHAYHQGDSYGPHRYSWDTYPLWIFDRLGAGNVYNPEQHFVPYWWIYTTRPDGQRLRAGDTFATSAPRGRPWSQYLGTLLTASYYHDGVLLDQFQRQGGSGGNETIFEVLWRDTTLTPKSIATLPLSRYAGFPFGWTVARTGWDANAVIAEMKVNEYNFVNHQHLDAGAFQIYYQGALALDSGIYEGGAAGGYGSTHCLNYSWRTIAHNSLLVYDPNEKFGGRGYGNDGGQRLPHGRAEARNLSVLLAPENGYRTGQVLAHGFGPDPQTPDFTFLQGDLTQAYSKKVRQVTRSFIFLNLRNPQVPAALIVFDRVVSTDPAFRKYWLLHTLEEPRIDGASAVVDDTQHGGRGRLTLDVLLPPAANADLTKIGGPGREYWVFGRNWANDVDPKRLERTSLEPGSWRIELSPKAAAAEDLFLNVMQVTDRQSPARWPVRRLEAGDRVGCVLDGPQSSWVVLLRRDNQRSAEPVKFVVPASAPAPRGLALAEPGEHSCRVLVTDLTPGRWHAQREGSAESRDLTVSEDAGVAWFAGPAGSWTLSRSTP